MKSQYSSAKVNFSYVKLTGNLHSQAVEVRTGAKSKMLSAESHQIGFLTVPPEQRNSIVQVFIFSFSSRHVFGKSCARCAKFVPVCDVMNHKETG